MDMKSFCLASLVAVTMPLLLSLPLSATGQFLGPTPYLSATDSPLFGGRYSYFHLEDFEDGDLNTLGASASAGWSVLGPGLLTDSVDIDDGVLDNSGSAGHSFYSNNTQSSLTITFSAAALGGNLPTHVGIAWTDVGDATPTLGEGAVRFSALDANGNALGSLGPFVLGDGTALSATGEDRFFGVIHAEGISSLTLTMDNSVDWEVDHLQYGFQPDGNVVPEPGSLTLLLSVVTLGARWCRTRKRPHS
jgi:hypothetical protein